MGGGGSSSKKEMTNEDIKDSKRMIVRAGRKMDRERKKLERENVKARKEIGKLAKKGQHNAAKIMSKDVARLNNQIQQTYMVTSQLKAIEFQLSSAMATKEISGIMGISAETLAAVNENMDISSIMNVCKDFAKNSDKLEMVGDTMNDAMEMISDPALDTDADKLYQQVLDEQALEINQDGVAVPKKQFAKEEVEEEKDDLESRLAALGK